MTEKQGGSDVRANTTRAQPLAEEGTYVLTGHKWFCSAPMSDGFLVLAQAPEGLTCFLLPRVLADGTRNAFAIQRLKDKLGNRSNASSEVEFDGTWARRVGEEGRGVATIIEMVAATRLDCALGSAALMRQAVAQAVHHATHRSAFGGPLTDKPLMRNVLADLALESEAATTTVLRLAAACDDDSEQERALRRLAVAVTKFWVTKRCPVVAAEALECLGGNGYVEESGMPRIFRESPLNSVWEGSGNVQALDVLRVLQREPQAAGRLPHRDRPGPRRRPPAGRARSRTCSPNSPTSTASRPGPAGSWSGWRWSSRARCWSASRPPRSPTRSAPPGWAATGVRPSARSPTPWTWPPWSTGPAPSSPEQDGTPGVPGLRYGGGPGRATVRRGTAGLTEEAPCSGAPGPRTESGGGTARKTHRRRSAPGPPNTHPLPAPSVRLRWPDAPRDHLVPGAARGKRPPRVPRPPRRPRRRH